MIVPATFKNFQSIVRERRFCCFLLKAVKSNATSPTSSVVYKIDSHSELPNQTASIRTFDSGTTILASVAVASLWIAILEEEKESGEMID